MTCNNITLKDRFLDAIISGKIGEKDSQGTIVTLKDFKAYFSDIKSSYASSFLATAAIDPGRVTLTHTKFVFRKSKGVYLVHPDAISERVKLLNSKTHTLTNR